MAGYIGSKVPAFIADVESASGDFAVGSDATVGGDVGIGTSSIDARLTLKNPSASGDQNIVTVQNASGTNAVGKITYNQTDDSLKIINASTFSGSHMDFWTGNTERMRIDSAGRVTKPNQPAFVANTSPSTFTNNVDIVWSATSLNRGSVYNTSNGRFTAPVAGLYQFFASVRIETTASVASYHRISFKHNGSYVQSSRSQLNHRTATGYYSHSSNDQAIYLNLNDYVNVTFETGGGSSSFSTSAFGEHVFYGYLLG